MPTEPTIDQSGLPKPSVMLLPVWLIVQPGLFFRAWGQRAPLGWMMAACWVIGVGSMATSVLNRIMSGSNLLPIAIETWTKLWIVVITAGVLRGLGIYWIGGSWFRARLWMSGEKSKCWKRSTRVYIGGRLVEQSVGVLGLIIYSLHFDTLGDFIAGDRFGWLILLGSVALVWGGVVSFLGARAVFSLNAWSWLWLFALPMVWRLGIVGVGLWVTLWGGPLSMESIARSSSTWNEPGTFQHDGKVINVVLADGWRAIDLDDGVRATNSDGQATWTARILPVDLVERERIGYIQGESDPTHEMDGRMGRWNGIIRQYRTESRTLVTVTSELDTAHALFFVHESLGNAQGLVNPDFRRCMASAYVVDERIIGVNTSSMRKVDGGVVQYEVPENWIERRYSSQPEGFATPIRQTTTQSPGAASIQILTYIDNEPRRESFEASWKELSDRFGIERFTRMTRWRDFDCDGATGQGTSPLGMPVNLTLVTIERPGGIKVDIVTLSAPHEPASLLRGLRLIEQSVRFTDKPLPPEIDAPTDALGDGQP